MERRDDLQREIGRLEAKLDAASSGRVIDELATVRRGLGDGRRGKPALELPNLRLGFACKQRWDDMVGDDRVRACAGCDRPVFNLSEMTRTEAERVLATRGLTPCVRFYRRPDGTVMTSDCPSGERREKRRLAVVASSLAAGTVLAVVPSAHAEPPPAADAISDAAAGEPDAVQPPVITGITLYEPIVMGIPVTRTFEPEMGLLIKVEQTRPKLEWSLWARLGGGVAEQHPSVLARRLTPTPPGLISASTWEAALAADVTVGIAHGGNLRLGAWTEIRTSSGPVAGGELVVEGLPPHPWDSWISGAGTVVLRAGGNAHVVTGALGFGYVGSRGDPWPSWARHVIGARVVASMNRSLEDPREWSATLGLEIEPIGDVRALIDHVKDHLR